MKAAWQRLRKSPLGIQLVVSSAGNAGTRIGSMGLSVLVGILLARTLGPNGLGMYSLAISIIAILTVPTEFGLPALVMREVAALRVRSEWGKLKGLLFFGNSFVLCFSVLVFCLLWIYLKFFSSDVSDAWTKTLYWAALLIPIIALGNLRSGALIGFEKIMQAQATDLIVRPAIFLLGLFFWWKFRPEELSPQYAVGIQVFAAGIAFLLGAFLLFRTIPQATKLAEPIYSVKSWLASSFPMALTESVRYIQGHVAILLLGWLATTKDVGLFRVANQMGDLVAFPLSTINIILSPYIARFFTENAMNRLRRVSGFGVTFSFLGALVIFSVFILFGNDLIGFLFGHEFTEAQSALVVLAAGQLLSSLMGPTATLLNMTRHEKLVTKAFVISVIFNIAFGFFLIPHFAIMGAAIASVSGLIVWNVLMWHYVRKNLHLEPSIFGLWIHRKDFQ